MDGRLSGLVLGAGLGLVLVVALAIVRPPASFEPPLPGPTFGPAVAEPSFEPPMAHEDVYARFAELGTARSAGEDVVLSVVKAGDVSLPSGRIVAADVYFFGNTPFTRWLPSGRHPVTLLRAEYAEDVRSVAAAMVRVAPGDPATWELALLPGQDPSTLGPGEFFGYGVDSGTGAFASAEAVEHLESSGDALWEAYSDEVFSQMFPAENVYRDVADVVLDPAAGLNVIGFSSGFGDGAYPSYFGLDEDGEPLVLLTNFAILDGPAPG